MTRLIIILSLILAVLFFRSFQPKTVLFSNDGPLGALNAERSKMPENYAGGWDDLNWLGGAYPLPGPSVSVGIRCICDRMTPTSFLYFLGMVCCGLYAFSKLRDRPKRWIFASVCFGYVAWMVVAMVFKLVGLELLFATSGLVWFVLLIVGEVAVNGREAN